MFTIISTQSDNKDFHSLVNLLDDELNSTYGKVQDQYDKLNKINNVDTVIIVYQDNNLVGCGCFKIFNKDSIEIKRMFVKAEVRGNGIAKMLLLELEKWAVEKGFSTSILETGIKQMAAMRLYAKLGYSRINNYGPYAGNANSICFSKDLKK
jgi:putative acetyltransferase